MYKKSFAAFRKNDIFSFFTKKRKDGEIVQWLPQKVAKEDGTYFMWKDFSKISRCYAN